MTLRNLSINGGTPAGLGLNGIRFLGGGALHVENCVIFGFSQNGIDVQPAPAAAQTFNVFVLDTVVRNCASAVNGAGILIKPGVNGTVNAVLDGVRLNQNITSGVRCDARTTVTVRNSEASGNTQFGFAAVTLTTSAVMNLESCVATGNATGIRSSGGTATIRMSNVTVVNNTINGLLADGGATILSFVNNRILGNPTNGVPTATQNQQ